MGAAPDSFVSSVWAIPHQPQSSGSQDCCGSIVWMVQTGQPWFPHRDPALLESREEDLLCQDSGACPMGREYALAPCCPVPQAGSGERG